MTEQECRKLLAEVAEAYPSFKKDRNPVVTLRIWHGVLRDIHCVDAQDALWEYIRKDTKGFPPAPGALLEIARRLEQWDEIPGVLTDCRRIRRAVRRGPGSAEEEYEALPPGVRSVLGSPEALRALASLDEAKQDRAVSGLTDRIVAAYLQGGTAALPDAEKTGHPEN